MLTDKLINTDGDIKENGGELLFDPYNPNNREITEQTINAILKKYGVPEKVHNINLYKRSFVHRSYCKRPHLENVANNITIIDKPNNCLTLKTKSNERLEFLGDGVLECITKYYLYRRFPKENEGFMTEKKIAIVKNETIGRMAYEMGLNRYYILSKNAEEKKTRTNLKKLGCLFESFLGALFLDFNKISINDEDDWFKNVFVTGPGFQIAQIFVENIFEQHVNWKEIITLNDNYKNLLQVKLQQNFKVTPIYKEIGGWDEDVGYHMGVYLSVNYKPHEFKHFDKNVLSISEFLGSCEKTDSLIIDKIKKYYDEQTTPKFIIFLGESKHKIKKKAEQRACKIGYEKIISK
jgi:dsRNA-specific ribonuclease